MKQCSSDKCDPSKYKNGAEVVMAALVREQEGFSTIFGIPGSVTYQFDGAIQGAINAGKCEYVHCTNEASAVFQASNFSLGPKKVVGVAMSTRGPGLDVAIVGLASARREEIPVVYLSGLSPLTTVDDYQIYEQSIFNGIAKQIFRIGPDTVSVTEINNTIKSAFQVAKHGNSDDPRAGPVVVLVSVPEWTSIVNIKECIPYVPISNLTGNEGTALNFVLSKWSLASKIVMRIGARVDYEVAQLMVKLARRFPQLLLVSVFDSRGLLSPDVSSKFLDLSGPVGNSAANRAIEEADLIIDAGIGVIYTTLVIEYPNKNVIRLFDEPIAKSGFFVNVNDVLLSLYNRRDNLCIGETFAHGNPTEAFSRILNTYLNQKNTIGNLVAKCLSVFYDEDFIATPNYSYVIDSGAGAFISGQLLRVHDNNAYLDGEFSPIGLSSATAAGLLKGGLPDAVVFVGDGAFVNMLSHVIDLKIACEATGKRALVLHFNDNRYGNIALGELALFGSFLFPSSTVSLNSAFDLKAYFNSFGAIAIHEGFSADFVASWKEKRTGFTKPGVYAMLMNGETAPIVGPQ